MISTRIQIVHHLLVTFFGLQKTLSAGCPPPMSPPVSSLCHTQCPAGWRSMNSACYIMVGTPLPWVQAENHCSELVNLACGNGVTGHLASIYGEAVNNFVHSLWRLNGRGDLAIDKYYWIGLTKQAGHLQWSDGSLPLYTNWETGVEDSLATSDDVCVYVSGQGLNQRRWAADDCSDPMNRINGLPFACELAQNPELAEPLEVPLNPGTA